MSKYFSSIVRQGIYSKVLTSYALTSVIPLVIIAYLSFTYIFPSMIEKNQSMLLDSVRLLIALTVILSLLGVSITINVINRVLKLIEKLDEMRKLSTSETSENRGTEDEIETISSKLIETVRTINSQLGELDKYAVEVDRSNSELVMVNKQLKQLSIRDSMTQLFNRRYLNERLTEEILRATRYGYAFALEMIDLDDFKKINDKFGHSQGDDVLVEFARLLKEHTRTFDIAARYGGEEFCLILPEINETDARNHAERLRKNIESHNFSNDEGFKINMTGSVGVAIFPEDAMGQKELIDNADSALYYAKKIGKNRSVLWGKVKNQIKKDTAFFDRKSLLEEVATISYNREAV